MRRTVVIVLAVGWLVSQPPPIIEDAIRAWFGRRWALVWPLESIASTGILLALVAIAPRNEETADASVAAVGFRRAANALWLRVMAVVAGVFVVVSAMSMRGSSGSFVELGLLTAAVVNLIAFVVLGVGLASAARAALPDLPRYPLTVAAVVALWCGGVVFAQLPWAYRTMVGYPDLGAEYATVLSLTMPVVATIGGAFAIAAISSLARRRGLHELQMNASATGIAWLALMIAGVALAAVATTQPSIAKVCLLAGSACAVMAHVAFAKLLGAAAASVGTHVGLPTAVARLR